jgi:hypothetical protein
MNALYGAASLRPGEKWMKPNRVAIALGCIGLTALAADTKMSSSELDHARLYLQQTQNLVIGATKGLSVAQWNFKPAPDRWSIAEIVEHMVLAQELILGPVRERLAKAPAPAGDNRQVDEVIISQMPDRTAKYQAPEPLQPTGRWKPAVSLERLLKNYEQLSEYLETPDLRQHAVAAPPLKAISKGAYDSMDGYQWILAAAAHVERHTKQILEVRADAAFPGK